LNRRRARYVVLALLLASFAGPWNNPRSYFPSVVEHVLRHPWQWSSLLLAAIVATPIACLLATIAPQSRLRVVAYRVLAGGTAVWIGILLARSPLSPRETMESWGVALYVVAIVLGSIIEFAPARGADKRDYTEVFR
jgi:hypothetical protein